MSKFTPEELAALASSHGFRLEPAASPQSSLAAQLVKLPSSVYSNLAKSISINAASKSAKTTVISLIREHEKCLGRYLSFISIMYIFSLVHFATYTFVLMVLFWIFVYFVTWWYICFWHISLYSNSKCTEIENKTMWRNVPKTEIYTVIQNITKIQNITMWPNVSVAKCTNTGNKI